MIQPLTELNLGLEAVVTAITSRKESRLSHLGNYGIVPGAVITLWQRKFAYLIRIDETEIALDEDIAREIMVRAI